MRVAAIVGVSSVLLAAPALACKCIAAYPVCNEVQRADRVFAGTVVAVTPALLDPWTRLGTDGPQLPAAEVAGLQKDSSAAALSRLKSIYLNLLRDTSAEARKRIAAASTHAELDRAFEAVTAHGRMIRFHVDKIWKSEASGDKDGGDKDDDDDSKFIDVWTDAGDCGVAFQKGETWLVYADEDEETSTLETSICTRTRRLTEAGSDLAYLFHYQETPKTSTRLEGFVSSDVADQFIGWGAESPKAPVGGATVRLTGAERNLYATTARGGSYVFDGLPQGEYRLSVFAAGFPEVFQVVVGPRSVKLDEKSCGREILIMPK